MPNMPVVTGLEYWTFGHSDAAQQCDVQRRSWSNDYILRKLFIRADNGSHKLEIESQFFSRPFADMLLERFVTSEIVFT
jgi:hypothetical protein